MQSPQRAVCRPVCPGVSDGTAMREAYRQFVLCSVEPLAKIVTRELATKLDVPDLRMSFTSLWAHDNIGRARSFASLIQGGMDVARAAGLSGLTAMETND